LALASALSESPNALDGREIALFSYGSGSCAEFFSGHVQSGAQARARASGWRALIESQRVIDVAEYEAIMNAREGMDTRDASEERGAGSRFLGVRAHRRIYSA
jgi:hydroxymethylglutaryl-CoA synthase